MAFNNDIDVDLYIDDTDGNKIIDSNFVNTLSPDEFTRDTIVIASGGTTTVDTDFPHIDGFVVLCSEAVDGIYPGSDTSTHNYAPNGKFAAYLGVGSEAVSQLTIDATSANSDVTVKLLAYYVS